MLFSHVYFLFDLKKMSGNGVKFPCQEWVQSNICIELFAGKVTTGTTKRSEKLRHEGENKAFQHLKQRGKKLNICKNM